MLWRYAYDLMGNRILEEKKNPGGKVEENNQLTEAVLCNGRTLVELNINGRTDTTYTYGVDRISKELFNQIMLVAR